MNPIAQTSPIDDVVAEYHHHLVNAAGLTPASCKAWTFYVRHFLTAQFRPKAHSLDWEQITAHRLLHYLRKQGQQYSLVRLQCLASALRSFCRFLCLSGRCAMDWSAALPRVGSQGRADLPEYLNESELEQLLSGFEDQSPALQRDHAIILCLARLGLRAGEVASLSLEDIRWRTGTLRLAQTKGRRERHLPLPAELGQVLAKYLKHARPKTSSRAVFISPQHPARTPW